MKYSTILIIQIYIIKNDNVINIIKLNLFKYSYKQSILFKFYYYQLIN